jgi:hypothetical protein
MGMSSLRRLEGRLRDCAWEELDGVLASDFRFLELAGPGGMSQRRGSVGCSNGDSVCRVRKSRVDNNDLEFGDVGERGNELVGAERCCLAMQNASTEIRTGD